MSRTKIFQYRPDGPILRSFLRSRASVNIIQGPVGSGTTTACSFFIWDVANEQEPDAYGIRRTRWLVVRNTFDELKQSTLKTWKEWFEREAMGAYGTVKMSNPPEHFIKCDLPDGTKIDLEVVFLSLDQEDDIRKLLSMEYTGAFFNEIQFSEKGVFDMAHSRAMQGRYPPKKDGGPTWKGVIGDLNAPPEGHWIPYMRGDVPLPLEWGDELRKEFTLPEGWEFFIQPSGLLEVFKNGRLDHYVENPEAENTLHLDEGYLELIKGKTKTWIDTYVMNRIGLYRKGKAVFESFVPETHVSKDRIKYQPEWPLIVGLDFARNPAAVMCQFIRGIMYVLDEFGLENVSAGTFAPLLKQRIVKNFPGIHLLDRKNVRLLVDVADKIKFYGDPTGGSKGQATDRTPYSIFHSHGMMVVAAPGNNSLTLRLEAVQVLLDRMVDGSPALLLDMYLRTLKAGMAGAYHFAKIRGSASRYHDDPYKDTFSDYCDALQYACLGVGLGFQALNPGKNVPKPHKMKKKRYSLIR